MLNNVNFDLYFQILENCVLNVWDEGKTIMYIYITCMFLAIRYDVWYHLPN